MKKLSLKGTSADAILLTCIKLVTTVLGLAITRLLSEYLSVHEYGTYSQILLIVSTVSSITIFGMMDGVSYFFNGERDAQSRDAYIATIFTLQCVVSAVAGAIVMLLMQPLCRYFDNSDIAPLLIFAAVLPLLQNLMFMSQVLFVAVGKARLLAFRNLAISLVRLAAVLIVVWFVQSATVVLIASVLLDVAQIAFFWIVLRKNGCRLHWRAARPQLLGNILRYCAPMAIYIMINTLNRDMDKYLISIMTDTETLALYANASKQLPFDILVASFVTVLVPYITRYLAEQKKKQAADLYKSFLEIAYISTGVLCCAALATAPQLMKLLYSNKYTAALPVFFVYIFVDLFRFANITLVLSAAGKTRTLMLLGLGSLGCNAVLNVVLYRWLDLIGPAIATLLVTMATGIIMLSLGARALDTRVIRLFNWRYLARFVAESAVLTVALSFVQQAMEARDIHYFLILVTVAGAYGLIMLLLHGKRLLRALKKVNSASNAQ